MTAKKRSSAPLESLEEARPGDVRTGLTVGDIKQAFLDNLFCGMGRVPMAANPMISTPPWR